MELLIMAYACKTSSARSIVGVIPYLPYSKQCKMRKRGCIVSKLLAKMMCTSGLTHIITMDLHQKEIQGFFDIPVDNLRASPFLLQYIQESVGSLQSLRRLKLNVIMLLDSRLSKFSDCSSQPGRGQEGQLLRRATASWPGRHPWRTEGNGCR